MQFRSAVLRYLAALLLAVAAQVARLPLHPQTLIPYITYVPFILFGAAYGGLGPGLLATVVCGLESLYFATAPIGSFRVHDPQGWLGLAILLFIGTVVSLMFEGIRRARQSDEAAREQLRAAHYELATIYGSAPVALLVLDEDLRVRKLNDMAKAFSPEPESHGKSIGAVIGCLNAFAHPEGCGHAPPCPNCDLRIAAFDCVRDGTRRANLEAWMPFSVAGSTENRCLLISIAPIHNGSRKVLVCAHDITKRKRAEESLRRTVAQLESALSQKTALLQEVHHRVKNNLAVISSLLGMKAEASGDSEASRALEESRRRVLSIALIHEHLYGSDRPDRIQFLEYTRQLVHELHAAQAPDPERIDIRLDVAPLEIDIQRAVPCALILNELVTNALKHAFPGGRHGQIRISFQNRDTPQSRDRQGADTLLELTVEDDGAGSPPGLLQRPNRSLGLKIVEILTRQLAGRIEQQNTPVSGTRFVLRFPNVPLP